MASVVKEKRNALGQVTFCKYHKYWVRFEYDERGNKTYYENSDGEWAKWEYDANGIETYYENSHGVIYDKRGQTKTDARS